jgi:putative transposase
MILTFKIKHEFDFSTQLRQAKLIAEFAIKNKDKLSSKYVKHFGLKSAISCQVLRKYGRNKNIKKISNIKLIVPNQGIKLNQEKSTITIPCLKISFTYQFRHQFTKVNQIEVDNQYFYIAVTVPEQIQIIPQGWVGVDRNTNGHCAVAACTTNNKILMLGKKAKHTHTKYSNIRKKLQKLGKFNKLKTIKHRESNIVKDLNHKISHKLVTYAKQNNCGIKLENLKGIRNNKKQAKSFKYILNSWSYYQLQTFILYKAKMFGVPVAYIDPAYTSQTCHKCGLLGDRNGKVFKCPNCGHTSHADVNAAWNIAMKSLVEPKSKHSKKLGSSFYSNDVYNQQLTQEEDCVKGNTDIPQQAPALSVADLKTL